MMRTMLTLERAHTLGLGLARTHTERFIDLVQALDAGDLARPLRRGGWTVGETVTHVESVYLRYAGDRRRADSPQGVAVQNAEDLTRLGDDVGRSVAAMRDTIALLEGLVPSLDPEQQVPFHAGRMTTIAGGLGNLLGELLAHGHDIGTTVGRPFAIPSEDTEILWRYTAPLLAGWLRPEATAFTDRWRFRFPFGDLDATFGEATVAWGPSDAATGGAGAGPDHAIDVEDGATFALTFPYRRIPMSDPALALFAARFYDL
jgi:hypothetical protein